MKSLAVWYHGPDEGASLDIHLNYWKLPSQNNSFSRFLDIGFNLQEASKVKKIFIYFPFSINTKDITDLTHVIAGGRVELLSAIFNEDYKKTTSSTSDYHKITDQRGNVIFHMYELSDSSFSILNNFGGSTISIELPREGIKKDKTYLRFRISGKVMEGFCKEEKNISSIFNSAFTRAEIFDFRINSKRHLPNKLFEEISRENSFVLKKIHLFYICSYRENYVLSHKPFFSARKLEEEIWDEYISGSLEKPSMQEKDTIIAYHWKQKEKEDTPIEEFSVLLKTTFRHYNWTTITCYLLFLTIFTMIAGVLSNYVYSDVLHNSNNTSKIVQEQKNNLIIPPKKITIDADKSGDTIN